MQIKRYCRISVANVNKTNIFDQNLTTYSVYTVPKQHPFYTFMGKIFVNNPGQKRRRHRIRPYSEFQRIPQLNIFSCEFLNQSKKKLLSRKMRQPRKRKKPKSSQTFKLHTTHILNVKICV